MRLVRATASAAMTPTRDLFQIVGPLVTVTLGVGVGTGLLCVRLYWPYAQMARTANTRSPRI
jgi:hypothetical protein